MSYSVGKNEGGTETVLVVGSPGSGGFTSTLTMSEDAVVQLIRLLAATLEDHGVEVYKHLNIGD